MLLFECALVYNRNMKHRIKTVEKNSIAEELGITPDSCLLSINGQEVHDLIDYQHLTANEELSLRFETKSGEIIEAEVEKDLYEPLGIEFYDSLMDKVRSCKNKCIFCFIDQMPKNSRSTLHFKDDDWRMSFIMGNYITLTNVSDSEFDRILSRRVSPLYISVHTTDPDLRVNMMGNPSAKSIMQRLKALHDKGLMFHSQIVLCPDINDGEHLLQTLCDLYSLYPASQSVAVVPVGLTKHREGLYPLRTYTKNEAREVIAQVHEFQKKALKETGTRFVFAADELYITAELNIPEYDEYEDFPQIENGVGLLRTFEYDLTESIEELAFQKAPRNFLGICGKSAYEFLSQQFLRLKPCNINIDMHAVTNNFFGETVTVSGLVCASDIIESLKGKDLSTYEAVLIPKVMLREFEEVFLDSYSIKDLESAINKRVIAVDVCGNILGFLA